MSYKALINKNINKAFNMLKDLAEDVTLVKKSSNTFNFGTGDVTNTESASILTKALLLDSNKKSDAHNVTTKNVMLKTQEVGDLNAYDKLTIAGTEWKFGPVINSDNYITLAEVFRET